MTKAAAISTFQSKPTPLFLLSSHFPFPYHPRLPLPPRFSPSITKRILLTHTSHSRCGIEIGLFINVRKCMILYLHGRNGSWSHAPYLDKHGEVDPGLRRNRQLFLSQKRYDALLRNVWLQHGIPKMISRKLEADMNNGGWETL